MIVVDTSAIIAILTAEPEADALSDCLKAAAPGRRVMSVANYVEAGAVIAGRRLDARSAPAFLDGFLDTMGISLLAVDERQAKLALEARIRFGKGFGAAARLNFGDSFAYALAKSLDAPLLFVGDDFALTDIRPALPHLT